MFGIFKPSPVAMGGLLWKNPWRLSTPRKSRVRQRLRDVDDVVATIAASGVECKPLTRALYMPTEAEMPPKDKYTTFSKTSRGFRKSVHKVPKWTRLSLRTNPAGF
ncbi:60s ribosomal protein l31 [Jaminaea rosea]|uniref:60s ribosomal protein l31 n=1 Tax=Jaminaea rosea TaxID=1569628 RepID=A0A316UN20_9BASI|nr:60s ribosomal protein l31 [Jaminaea rosea]PWN26702.1 60s ribosomal protein l31 [Jaminaea rosea]